MDDVLLSVLNLHARMKLIKIRSRPRPFVNQEIKELMKSRDLLLKTSIRVKKMLFEAERKHTFEEVRLHKNNPTCSSPWKIINRAIPSKDKESPAYTKNLSVVGNEFNQFFFPKLAKIPLMQLGICQKKNLTSQFVNFQSMLVLASPLISFSVRTVTVEEFVASLPLNKTPGLGKVNARPLPPF